MWQPRLGIAWNVRGNGTTVVRLSGGIFDAHTPGYLMQKIFTDNGLNTLVLDTNVDPTLVNFTDRTKARRCASHGCQDFTDWLYFRVRSGLHESCSGQVALAIEQQIDNGHQSDFRIRSQLHLGSATPHRYQPVHAFRPAEWHARIP